MIDRRLMDIGELKALLASSDVLPFKESSPEEIYAWIERTLRGKVTCCLIYVHGARYPSIECLLCKL